MHHNEPSLRLQLAEDSATIALGEAIAPCLSPGMHLHLRGELGAGKTTLIRALLRKLGVQGPIKSPSYTLVEPYTASSLYLYHFDFYRFRESNEWLDSGFREYFATPAVCLVEWPEKAGAWLSPPDLDIDITITDTGRDVSIQAFGELGTRCVTALRKLSLARIG